MSTTLDPRIVEWNSSSVDFPRDSSLHALIVEQCSKTPDKVAVRTATEDFTYAEILRRSQALSKALITSGIGDLENVAICVSRSENMIISVLGCLQANCRYIPLDPIFAMGQMTYIVRDGNVKYLVTDDENHEFVLEINDALREADGSSAIQLRYLVMNNDFFSSVTAEEVDYSNETRTGFDSERVCYTMYTSGSTGQPKGVVIRHRNVINFIMAMIEEPGMDETDVVVALTTQTFDISIMEYIQPLCVGALSVVVTRDIAMNGYALMSVLKDNGVTFLQATPATFRLLVEAGWTGDRAILKNILCGGEPFPSKLAGQLLGTCQNLWNMYGPTETTVWCTGYLIREVPKDHGIPVGKGVHNVRAYILDEDLQSVDVGETGDIYIAGEGVGVGYLNLPEVTAKGYKPDPFYPGEMMFKTGDIGKFKVDTGDIICMGRSDFQVKIRGYRVELHAIELHAESHPTVKHCVVTAVVDPKDPDTKRLVAYIELRPGEEFKPTPLQDHIRANVPEYMVPGLYVKMDEFPISTNGKVDRKKLPEPDESHLVSRALTAEDKPTSLVQAMLCKYVCEMLGIASVSVQDNLFKIGADSLAAMKIQGFIAKEMQRSISPLMVFKNNTVLKLEAIIGPNPLISIDHVDFHGDHLPLTLASAETSLSTSIDQPPSPVGGRKRSMLKSPRRSLVGGLMNIVGISPRVSADEIGLSRSFARNSPVPSPMSVSVRKSVEVSPEPAEGDACPYAVALTQAKSAPEEGPAPDLILSILPGFSADAPYDDLIVPIQEKGSRTPIFLVHAAGGFVYPYFSLAASIGDDQPLYAIQDPSELDNSNSTPFESLEEMAAAYVIAVTRKQPNGPYNIGGWSMGGSVAWEMAVQLRKLGKEVNSVILIDSECCERYQPVVFFLQYLVGGLGLVRDVLEQKKYSKSESSMQSKAIGCLVGILPKKNEEIGEREIKNALSHGEAKSDTSVKRMLLLINNHMRLLSKYTPTKMDRWYVSVKCKVQPKKVTNAAVDPFELWGEYGEGEQVELPGDHFGIFRNPNAEELSEILRLAVEGRPVSFAYPRKKDPSLVVPCPKVSYAAMAGGGENPRVGVEEMIQKTPDVQVMRV